MDRKLKLLTEIQTNRKLDELAARGMENGTNETNGTKNAFFKKRSGEVIENTGPGLKNEPERT